MRTKPTPPVCKFFERGLSLTAARSRTSPQIEVPSGRFIPLRGGPAARGRPPLPAAAGGG
jgi:hypothetical protein